jgi:four helix bundle protein
MKGKDKPQDIKERSFNFAVRIVRFCLWLEKKSDVYRILGRQLLKAGTSIGANVEESQAGQSKADFVSKYSIALKEARETIYWLRLIRETLSLKIDEIDNLIQEADEISRIIGSIIVNTKRNL